jgi:hypothetical protein
MSSHFDRALAEGRDAIAAAIQRLFRALDDDDEDAVDALQGLVDRLLDEAPAASTLVLERRLLGLATALEELGADARESLLFQRALEWGERPH